MQRFLLQNVFFRFERKVRVSEFVNYECYSTLGMSFMPAIQRCRVVNQEKHKQKKTGSILRLSTGYSDGPPTEIPNQAINEKY